MSDIISAIQSETCKAILGKEDIVKIPVDLAKTHFFDKDTELAICH